MCVQLANVTDSSLSCVQVSTEESPSRKSSTESREFWEETTQLLQDLSILREDVDEIECPCNRPQCPFKHSSSSSNSGRAGRRSRTARSRPPLTPRQRANSEVSRDQVSGLLQKNVVSFLASIQQQQQQEKQQHYTQPFLTFSRRDTLVTEEPLAALLGQTIHFVRSSPSRRPQRRHCVAMRGSNSYPATMNSLTVPCCPEVHQERWCSVPHGMESRLGNSLDSLDTEKLQDIQKSYLQRQRLHSSSIELEQW